MKDSVQNQSSKYIYMSPQVTTIISVAQGLAQGLVQGPCQGRGQGFLAKALAKAPKGSQVPLGAPRAS